MDLKLPFDRVICGKCTKELAKAEDGLKPDYQVTDVHFPEEDRRPARKVPIKIMEMNCVDLGKGRTRAQVKVRVPCINGDHQHDIDISDLYRAPQLHLEGALRCSKGHKMTFQRRGAWKYIDEGEFGGVIEVSGILSCSTCQTPPTRESLLIKAPDLQEAEAAGKLIVQLDAATRRMKKK